jgi:lipoyl(octanoyl) transferase
MQKKAFELVKDQEYKGILLVLEHAPVYTIGTGGGQENLLRSKEYIESQGVDIVQISRGGNITFHGPGQIVAYPIFNLNFLRKDTHWFIDCLENAVIDVLGQYGIKGSKKPEYRGTWVEDEKISAVGVAVRKWVTFHGLSFNINLDKEFFNWINPCGITEFGVTSLEDHVSNFEINTIKDQLIKSLENVFEITLESADEKILKKD